MTYVALILACLLTTVASFGSGLGGGSSSSALPTTATTTASTTATTTTTTTTTTATTTYGTTAYIQFTLSDGNDNNFDNKFVTEKTVQDAFLKKLSDHTKISLDRLSIFKFYGEFADYGQKKVRVAMNDKQGEALAADVVAALVKELGLMAESDLINFYGSSGLTGYNEPQSWILTSSRPSAIAISENPWLDYDWAAIYEGCKPALEANCWFNDNGDCIIPDSEDDYVSLFSPWTPGAEGCSTNVYDEGTANEKTDCDYYTLYDQCVYSCPHLSKIVPWNTRTGTACLAEIKLLDDKQKLGVEVRTWRWDKLGYLTDMGYDVSSFDPDTH